AIVFPHSYQVRDYAPKLATRCGRALVSDVIAIGKGDGQLTFVRQLFQGKLNVDIRPAEAPVFVSVQAGAFRAPDRTDAAASIEDFSIDLSRTLIRSKPEPPFQEAQRSVDLTAADYIVSVGRG